MNIKQCKAERKGNRMKGEHEMDKSSKEQKNEDVKEGISKQDSRTRKKEIKQ